MNSFFIDSERRVDCTYDQLIQNLKKRQSFNPYCYTNDYYQVFENIILSLLYGREIILVDGDFSISEISSIVGETDFNVYTESVDFSVLFAEIKKKEDLLTCLEQGKERWSITLFTSGTTGLPKKVTHNFESITRFVKLSKSQQNAIWGLAYSPTHMAGLQLFFQAILNGCTIVRLYQLEVAKLHQEITGRGITHISATPTFFRLMLAESTIFPQVLRVTSGGEKVDGYLVSLIKSKFPNAKFTNVYASTEIGALFAAHGDVFTVNVELTEFVKVEEGELYVHKKLLGKLDNVYDSWYATGDLVEVLETNPLRLKFITRKNEMINTGGNKVNPEEVEEALRQVPGVCDSRVFGRKNSLLGSVVCCEVIRENESVTEHYLRNELVKLIQEFKVPRLITFVAKIEQTRSGKIKR